ncbi:MAG: FAD:protein FMN transferase [Actinomycetota bacterium]|nr:FAD:protein FMN transferase [Actinomycetota bacterium]
MGTVVTFDVYSDNKEDLHDNSLLLNAIATSKESLRQADQRFSTYKDDSWISINKPTRPSNEYPADVRYVLEVCDYLKATTRGAFDHHYRGEVIDPTGIVKGWAVEQALPYLRVEGISGAIVNGAGDIASFGTFNHGKEFSFGVVDPTDRSKIAFVVQGAPCVATSALYERGDHIVDPRYPRRKIDNLSATVVGPSLTLADGLATAIFVAGLEVFDVIESLNGYECALTKSNGRLYATRSFPFRRQN